VNISGSKRVLIQRSVTLLLIAAILGMGIGEGYFSQSFLHNLAYLMLMRWIAQGPSPEGQVALARAEDLGGKADVAWAQPDGRAQTILHHLSGEAWNERQRVLGAYAQAVQLEQQGDRSGALAEYGLVSRRSWLRVEADYAAYQLSQEIGDEAQAQFWLNQLTNFEPHISGEWPLADDQRLMGYDVDAWSMDWEPTRVPVVFYWQVPASSAVASDWQADGWHYIQVNTRLYQSGEVANLLPDAGFEQDWSALTQVPLGYRPYKDIALDGQDYVAFLRAHYRLVDDLREGEMTRALAIVNTLPETNGLTVRPWIQTQPGMVYVFSGAVKVVGESEAYLCLVWLSSTGEQHYWNLVKWVSVQSWQEFVKAGWAPQAADWFTPYALNRGIGEVLFDNLVLFAVPLPSMKVGR